MMSILLSYCSVLYSGLYVAYPVSVYCVLCIIMWYWVFSPCYIYLLCFVCVLSLVSFQYQSVSLWHGISLSTVPAVTQSVTNPVVAIPSHYYSHIIIILNIIYKRIYFKDFLQKSKKNVGMGGMKLLANNVHIQGMGVLLADKVHKQEPCHNVWLYTSHTRNHP